MVNMECNQWYLPVHRSTLIKCLPVPSHSVRGPGGSGWTHVVRLLWSMGTVFSKGGFLRCPTPLPPLLPKHMKQRAHQSHSGADMIFFFYHLLVVLKGLFQRCSSCQSLRPCWQPTPQPSSFLSVSKAWATPNVNDVSLAIVHGWPHLNGWLVPRPAPYNCLLSHSDLFSASPPPHHHKKRTLSLSCSLSSLAHRVKVKLEEMEHEIRREGRGERGRKRVFECVCMCVLWWKERCRFGGQ